MPIIVSHEEISETLDYLFIRLPLKHRRAQDVDVIIFKSYVKVSYPPYFYEAFLTNSVCDLSSAVRFENDWILLTLKKAKTELWDSLLEDFGGDKGLKSQFREDILKQYGEEILERQKKTSEKKSEQGRENTRSMMKLEQQERERLEKTKETEKRLALSHVYESDTVDQVVLLQEIKKEQEKAKEKHVLNKAKRKEMEDIIKSENSKTIFNNGKCLEQSNICPTILPKTEVVSEKPIPAVRSTGTIKVGFTHRVFPTPMRESKAVEEEEWLKKQAEARKITEIDEKELSEAERDPDLMKKKAEDFYKQGNFLAAANAYTQAIRLRPNFPSYYSNRAACHLQVNNLMKCVEDSSKALELLTPHVTSNEKERLLAHIRRGTALAKLELVVEGLADYTAALKILPPNDPMRSELERDADAMRQHIQSSSV